MWGLESYFDRSRRDKKKYDSKNKKDLNSGLYYIFKNNKQKTKNQVKSPQTIWLWDSPSIQKGTFYYKNDFTM